MHLGGVLGRVGGSRAVLGASQKHALQKYAKNLMKISDFDVSGGVLRAFWGLSGASRGVAEAS